MGKIFKNYSDLKPLNHFTANFAGMYIGWSFTKNFGVWKSKTAVITGHNFKLKTMNFCSQKLYI